MTQSYASSAGTSYTTQESDVNLSSQLWTSHVAANAILLRLPLAKTTLSSIRFFSLPETVGDGVGVVVVESRQERSPLEIDHAGGWPDLIPDLGTTANARDAIADDRYRLGGRLVIIDRNDHAIQENEIGGHQ
jgi:hypothetical protein